MKKLSQKNRQANENSGSSAVKLPDHAAHQDSFSAISNPPAHTFGNMPVQARLQVNTPGDKFEREAEATANKVMSKAAGTDGNHNLPRLSATKGVQQKGGAGIPVSPALTDKIKATQGKGSTMDSDTQSFMSGSLGADFSKVKIHTDNEAAKMNQQLSAKAFTVGDNIYFNQGLYQPGSSAGKHLLAHELAHTVQQSNGKKGSGEKQQTNSSTDAGIIQRTPAPPLIGTDNAPFDRSKVAVNPVADVDASAQVAGKPRIKPQSVSITINDPSVVYLAWNLYDPTDKLLSVITTDKKKKNALTAPFPVNDANIPSPVQGRYTLRCTGYDISDQPVTYADRSFFVWTSTPAAKPPDIASLETTKATLEADTKAGSGKSFAEVGSSFTKQKEVGHQLSILQTGTGTYVGNQSAVQPTGIKATDCTEIVLEVLRDTFAQQNRASDWAKVVTQYKANTKARGATTFSGLDVQAALQSEAGWKGIYWAPDPKYLIPKAELANANSDEASFNLSKSTYYKDFGKAGYPGVTIDQKVTNYAPEVPNKGYGTASKTKKDTTQLDKLKKLPFGILSAHGGFHMTVITYGKVIEVHWDKEATDPGLFEETDLESWAIGPNSGYHYYASGIIVAPAADVKKAFP